MFDIPHEDLERVHDLLTRSQDIAITCHLGPDGDALGSSLGLKWLITKANPRAHVTIITPDEPPHTLRFLPGYKDIMPWSRYGAVAEKRITGADLTVCLDYNQLKRIDRVAPAVTTTRGAILHIDHHLNPQLDATVQISRPVASSTCFLLYNIIKDSGLHHYIDANCANCLLAGMMTDTGNFTYNLNGMDAANEHAAADLMTLGADRPYLYKKLFNTFSEDCIRLNAYALEHNMQVFHEQHAALITLTRNELNAHNYRRGDTEGLVNRPLAIPGIAYCAFLREENGYIKVSMRSVGDFPVNILCRDNYNGGGHLNASGGEYYGTMQQCAHIFVSQLQRNKQLYIDNNPTMQAILDDELK